MEYTFDRFKMKGVSIMKNNELKAVIDDDLEPLLQSLGVYEDVLAGKSQCAFCNDILTIDNIEAILPIENEIGIICNRKACMAKLFTEGA